MHAGRFATTLALAGLCSALGGCGSQTLAPRPPTWRPEQAKCSVSPSQSEPLIVEWSNEDRAKLEALAREGAVAVRQSGCEMRILGQCHALSRYGYVGTTRKNSVEQIKTADELFAKLPFGAVRLETTLERSGQLDVSMAIVGRYAATPAVTSATQLAGDCGDATHVVSAVIVGAFEFSATGRGSVKGDISVFDAGGGIITGDEKTVLTRDGDPAACAAATVADLAPPPQCGAMLRLELTPLREAMERIADTEARAESAYRADRDRASTFRTVGYVGAGAGLLGVGAGGLLAYLSAKQNDAIQGGGFATSGEIADAESQGSTYNAGAYVGAIAGGVLLLGGAVLVLTHPEPGRAGADVALSVSPDRGVWMEGRF